MSKTKLFIVLLLSWAWTAIHAETLIYRSVEKTTITGDGKRIPLSIKGTLALDWNGQGPASVTYIGTVNFRGQLFYLVDSLEAPEVDFEHRKVVFRRLPGRPEQAYTFLKLNFSRFDWVFQDLAKGTTRPLSIPPTLRQIEFPKSFRGGARALFTDPQVNWFSLESKSTFVFMSTDTLLANQGQLTSAAYRQQEEARLKAQGYTELTSLQQLLSLVP